MSARSTAGLACTEPFRDASEMKVGLLAQAEAVCRHLLSAGTRLGNEWHCGNLRGEPGRSLSVNLITGVWRDFATGEGGSNLLELWIRVRGVDFPTALREASDFCGMSVPEPARSDDDKARQRAKWTTFQKGSPEDIGRLATLRNVLPRAVEILQDRQLLFFADLPQGRAWIVTDKVRVNATARPLSGARWEHLPSKPKAWTLPGSIAAWPIGLEESSPYAKIALVEGAPDFLSVLHHAYCEMAENQVAPVMMAGASLKIPMDALAMFAVKRVRIFIHDDKAGRDAAWRWATQLKTVGAAIDGFDFSGLFQSSGEPVKDLNDLCRVDADCWETHGNLIENSMSFTGKEPYARLA